MSIEQPVVLFNPKRQYYIKVTFSSDGSIDCFKTNVFDETCILALHEVITPLNLLVSCSSFNETLQILKVGLIEDTYYVQHVKGAY